MQYITDQVYLNTPSGSSRLFASWLDPEMSAAHVSAARSERSGDPAQGQVGSDLVVDGIERQDEIDVLDPSRVVASCCSELHVAQPVSSRHPPRGVGAPDPSASSIPVNRLAGNRCARRLSWAPQPQPISATSMPSPEAVGHPGKQGQYVVHRHRVDGVELVGVTAGPQLARRCRRQPRRPAGSDGRSDRRLCRAAQRAGTCRRSSRARRCRASARLPTPTEVRRLPAAGSYVTISPTVMAANHSRT